MLDSGLQAKVLNHVVYYTYADLLFEEGKISKKIILINLNLRFSLLGSGFLHYILHDPGLNHEIAVERKE